MRFIAQTGEGTSKEKVKQVQRSRKQKENKISAQSGDGNNVHEEVVTKFCDDNEVHKTDDKTTMLRGSIPRIPRIAGLSNLEEFLSRPRLVETFSWVSTDAILAQKFSGQYPYKLLQITPFRRKMEQNQWWRPDIEFEVQINSTHFHYGRLLFVVYRFPKWLHSSQVTPEGATSWPEWYQLSANAQQSLKFVVPYQHMAYKVPINSVDDLYTNMFVLACYVSAPLLSAMAATVAPVTVNVFARAINTDIGVYTFTQSGEQEIMKLSDLSMSSLVSKPLTTVATAVLGVNNTVSAVAKDVLHLGAAVGLSNPVNPAVTNSMQVRQPLFGKSDDMNNSIILGPSQTTRLNTSDPNLANGTPDEMSIVRICSQPSLLYTGKVLSTNSVDDVLAHNFLNPLSCIYGDYSFANPAGTLQPSPMYYIARMFRLWRGSFKFHISFICSSFHSCRLRFVWQPSSVNAAIVSPTAIEQLDMYNVVMDINKQTDYSILIPFDQSVNWLSTRSITSNSVAVNNGNWSLILMTKLTSSIDTPQPIYYQIFVSLADDAQFALPYLADDLGDPRFTNPVGLRMIEDDSDDELLAQAGEVMMCDLPTSSSQCLRDTVCMSIVPGNLPTKRIYGEATSYEFASVKQLTNMLTPFRREKTVSTTVFSGAKFSPFAPMIRGNTDDVWTNLYCRIRAIYRFGRGSIRLVGMIDAQTTQAMAYVNPFDAMADIYVAINTDPFLNDTGDLALLIPGFQYFLNTELMPADVTIPYFSTTPCQLFINNNASPHYYAQTNAGIITFSVQDVANLITVYFAATGDDFVFGSLCGMPKLYTSAAP